MGGGLNLTGGRLYFMSPANNDEETSMTHRLDWSSTQFPPDLVRAHDRTTSRGRKTRTPWVSI